MHLVDLALVQQQLARAFRLMVEAVAVAELGDVGVDQPDLIAAHLRIGFRDRSFAEAQRLHLGAGERDAGLEHLLDRIVEPRAPVLGDHLFLVEHGGFGSGHGARLYGTVAGSGTRRL